MPAIDSTHPQYDKNVLAWRKCRDAVEGEDAVKAAEEDYVPRLEDQTNDEYDSYLARGLFYGASGRTVIGLAGAITRKPPVVEFPDSKKDFLNHVGWDGSSLELLAVGVLMEVLTTGRLGLLVDAPDEEGGEPYVVIYAAENVISWEVSKVAGVEVMVRVVLHEVVEQRNEEDEYIIENKEQWRVLFLRKGADVESLVYEVELYEKQVSKDARGKCVEEFLQMGETIRPKQAGGNTLDYIPFTFVGPSTTSPKVDKSPILDLVNVNFSHFRNSVDLEHGRHFTALPTAWVAGFNLDDNSKLKIGSATAWVADEPTANAGFLEFTGAGLGSLSDALKDKERLMAVLGARLLEEDKAVAEAAKTVSLRQAGEQSVLARIASSCEEALGKVLRWSADWLGVGAKEDSISVLLNRDFDTSGIDPTVLAGLVHAVQGGLMSFDTFFYNLKKAEVYPDSTEMEDELSQIQESIPVMGGVPGGSIDNMGDDDLVE